MLPDYKPAVVTGVPVPPYNDDPEADNIVIIDTFILIHKDQPTVTVADFSQVTVGETATGTVTVSGVIGITPTGSMTFNLYGPSTTTDCTGTAVSESTVNLNDGSAQSSPYTPTTAGSYYWVASYSGDDNYLASTTACGENGGTLIVNPGLKPQPAQLSPKNPLSLTTVSLIWLR